MEELGRMVMVVSRRMGVWCDILTFSDLMGLGSVEWVVRYGSMPGRYVLEMTNI